MELIERPDINKIHYLKDISYNDFKLFIKTCKNEKERQDRFEKLKAYCSTNIKTRCETKRIYSFTDTYTFENGGRLYCGNSIQNIPKDIRGFLYDGITTDIDMKNCHAVILQYICKLNNINCPNISYYVLNRDTILNDFADDGKILFIKAVNSDKRINNIDNKFFKAFDKECKEIQKQITKLDIYKDIVNCIVINRTHNYLGCAINRILCMYENKVLQELISILNKKNIEICALMYDGLLMYGNHYDNKELLEDITTEINDKFENLNMTWTYKEHSTNIKLPEDYKYIENHKDINLDNIKICNNDGDASKIIYNEIKHNLIFSQKVLYYKQDNMWINDIAIIKPCIITYIIDSNIYKKNKHGEIIDYSNNVKSAENIYKNVINIAIKNRDNEWYNNIFTSSLGKILFNNGYYDFKISKFINTNDSLFDTSIIFTENTNYNWIWDDNYIFTIDELNYIDNIRNKIFYNPFGKEVGDYYILQLARGLAGDCMKRCIFGIGSGNTGKSLISSALKYCCGGYYGSFNGINITYNKHSADEAQKLRWIMLLQSKRIICSNEIQMGINLDGNMIKKISNGGIDDIIARTHCGNETPFVIAFLPIIFANDLDNITPKADDALNLRIRAINYKKVFVDNPTNDYELQIDTNFNKEIKTDLCKKALMYIMMIEYKKFIKNGSIEYDPPDIIKAKTDILGKYESIIELFEKDFEITENLSDYIECSIIKKWLEKTGISDSKFSRELNKYIIINNKKNIYSHDIKINKKTKRVWYGIKYEE